VKILLCHERFVLRYGVDRVLLALAREFRRLGHHVTLLGQAFDESPGTTASADRIIHVPAPADTLTADVVTAAWLAEHWEEHFARDARPDLVLDAGWPFFSAIPIFESHGCRVIYQDHGVIPKDGMPEIGWRTLHLLEDLKSVFVREASAVVAVSTFLRDTQSRACVRPDRPLVVIPNGVDHLAPEESAAPAPGPLAPSLPRLDPSAAPLRVLCSGRFEPGLYKQSELVFALEARLRAWAPEAWIGTFADPETLAAAAAAAGATTRVVALGRPTDDAMVRLMRSSDAVVCFSRWEGFNLPLAEAQMLGRPCLVFDIGAHPEVVADRWQLCADLDEMAARIRALAEGAAPAAVRDGSVFRAWRSAPGRSWLEVAGRYLELFERVCATPPSHGAGDTRSERPLPGRDASPRRSHLGAVHDDESGSDEGTTEPGLRHAVVLMDVTNAARDPSNSGCVRVTRRLAAEWQAWLEVIFVVWEREAEAFRFPTAAEFAQLGAYRGPVRPPDHPVSAPGVPVRLETWLDERSQGAGSRASAGGEASPGWLLLPEIRHRPDLWPILEFAARVRWRTASIFHDAIPIERPELVPDPAYREGHADYMRGLSRVDINVANSRASAEALRAFWRAEGLSGRVASCLLPGGLPGERPGATGSRSGRGDEAVLPGESPFILMVSTLEPRKGFRRLIEAFLEVRGRAHRSDWRLVLVGGRSWWSAEITRFVEAAVRDHPEITWLENAPDDRLGQLYRDCAFTVYASEIEGFGLPIMESVWHGRPCLCHDDGVMRELAAGGGCVAADLLEPAAFQAALLQLMNDDALRARLAAACRARSVKRWRDFAAEFWARLACTRWAELESPHVEPCGEEVPPAPSVAGRLSCIIPTYNRLDLLQACLRSLHATLPAGIDVETIVVDDGSGDGTRAWLERGDGAAYGLRVLRHATNRGYGAAINHAARVATGASLVLLNHDLTFRPGWLEPMLAAARRRPACFAVGNLQCAARDGGLDHAGIVFDPTGHPEHFRAPLEWIQRVDAREFPAVTFACALVDRAKFLALGGLDRRFLNGCEDVDLCLRARCQGWPSVVATCSVVDHQVSATPGRKLAETENLQRFFARWQSVAIVLGRDWEERLFWERSEDGVLPDDSRLAGPLRVLVDLTPCADPFATATGVLASLAAAGTQPLRAVVLVSPVQCQALEATNLFGDAGSGTETWCFVDRGDAVPARPGIRVVSGPAVTVARRLQADVVVAVAGPTRFATPDVPLLSPEPGDPTGPDVSTFRAPIGLAQTLASRVRAACDVFAAGGVSWRWSFEGREASARPPRLNHVPADAGGGRHGETSPAGTSELSEKVLFCIDEPVVWEERVPLIEIRGWCLHRESVPVTEVYAATAAGRRWPGVMGRARPDVAAAFPAIPTAATSGFSVRVPASSESFEIWIRGDGFIARLREWRAGGS